MKGTDVVFIAINLANDTINKKGPELIKALLH